MWKICPKFFSPTTDKIPRKKIFRLHNTPKKNFPTTKYPEKNFPTTKYPEKNFIDYKIPTKIFFRLQNTPKKIFPTTKYPAKMGHFRVLSGFLRGILLSGIFFLDFKWRLRSTTLVYTRWVLNILTVQFRSYWWLFRFDPLYYLINRSSWYLAQSFSWVLIKFRAIWVFNE